MKKLWIVLASLLALLAVAYLGVLFFCGSLVRAAVDRFGPQLTGTRVTLAAADISPLSGKGTLQGLVVGNPAGWSNADAISLQRIHIEAVPSSLFSDHVVINDLEIDGPRFLYETKLVSSNIGDLVKHIEGGKQNPQTQAQTSSGSAKRFEIKHLVIQGGKITLAIPGATSTVISMPRFEFNDLGSSEGGVTSAELAALIAKSLLQSVAKSALQAVGKVGQTGTGAASDVLRGALNMFKH
jgi:uncharacterized protein involved in outer membrane biogenesis